MAKRFLTARDIDQHADQGVFEIEVGDDLVITDIGQERARERGVKLIRLPRGTNTPTHPACDGAQTKPIEERVRAAVISKLGSAPDNLDAIIAKVINGKQ